MTHEHTFHHIEGQEDSESPLFSSLSSKVKSLEKYFSSLSNSENDSRSLQEMGFKVLEFRQTLEHNVRHARRITKKFCKTLRDISAKKRLLHRFTIHPVTGELTPLHSPSLSGFLFDNFAWFKTKFSSHGTLIYPLVAQSWSIAEKLLKQHGDELVDTQGIQKKICNLLGAGKAESKKCLQEIEKALTFPPLPHFYAPVFSYHSFPHNITLQTKTNTKYLIHKEILGLYIPSIHSLYELKEPSEEEISAFFNPYFERFPEENVWNIIFSHLYKIPLSFLILERQETLFKAYCLADQLMLFKLKKALEKYIPVDHKIPDTSCENKKPLPSSLKTLKVHLSQGKDSASFPIQLLSKNNTLSSYVIKEGSLDLRGSSLKAFSEIMEFLFNKECHTFSVNSETVHLIYRLNIPELTNKALPLILPYLLEDHYSEGLLTPTEVDFSLSSYNLSIAAFTRMMQHISFECVEILSLKDCQQMLESEFTQLISCLPNLQTLDISYCTQISSEAFRKIASHTPYLTELKASHLPGIYNEDLIEVLRNTAELTYLDINHCSNLSGNALKNISFYCPNLRVLKASNLKVLLPSDLMSHLGQFKQLEILEILDIKQVSKSLLKSLSESTPELKTLKISTLEFKNTFPRDFFKKLSKLDDIHLEGFFNLESLDIKELFEKPRHLKKLCLSHSPFLKDKAFMPSSPLYHLEALELSKLSSYRGKSLPLLLKDTPIHSLSLRYCSRLEKKYLLEALSFCKNLQSLDLSFCRAVDDEIISKIAHSCPKLKELRLACCSKIKGETLETLGSLCPKLKLLDLGKNLNIPSENFLKLKNCVKNLQHLGFAKLHQISKKDLRSLLDEARLLETLVLNQVTAIDDTLLKEILDKNPELQDLRLYFCTNLSTLGLIHLQKESVCKKLKILEIRGIHTVENETLSMLLDKPLLEKVYLSAFSYRSKMILQLRKPYLKIHANAF